VAQALDTFFHGFNWSEVLLLVLTGGCLMQCAGPR
jgi:hypothetical protein